jgi:hypothetical protein
MAQSSQTRGRLGKNRMELLGGDVALLVSSLTVKNARERRLGWGCRIAFSPVFILQFSSPTNS